MTDMEGVAGIDDWDPRHREDAAAARGVRDREEMQRLLTGEVMAAVKGLRKAGVEDIVVNDAHGAGRTILVEELKGPVRIARGTERTSWVMGLEPGCQALVQVGMHAMAKTAGACLCHTMSTGYVYKVNGVEVGEMELCAYLLGDFGIPWIFTSGDGHGCREAERFVPGMVTAPVKEGLSPKSAVHLTPRAARRLIEARVREAAEKVGQIAPLRAERPTVLEIVRDDPWAREIPPGAKRVDAFTLRYKGPNIWQAFNDHFYGRPDLPPPMEIQ
ncbi:MAG: M55 family metallopeptidase [Gemmatimonadota bacterium]